jgi:hypothetical protein
MFFLASIVHALYAGGGAVDIGNFGSGWPFGSIVALLRNNILVFGSFA